VSDQNLYIFLLCLMVFLISAGFLILILVYVYRLEAKSIRSGLLDEEIREYKVAERAKTKGHAILSNIFGFTMLGLVSACFIFGLVTYLTNYDAVGDIPSYKVVLSESMQAKHEDNTYLVENHLDDQFSRFDLVQIDKMPEEGEIELYDIVVYQAYTGDLVIHRIVNIEGPNESHPDSYLYTFQGDNVSNPDTRKVTYSQMKGIYHGVHIPYVGKIVAFFQSYAGYLCVGIVVFYVLISPFIERKQDKLIDARAKLIFAGDDPDLVDPEEKAVEGEEAPKPGEGSDAEPAPTDDKAPLEAEGNDDKTIDEPKETE